jgi:predicted ATPase/DNA-binding winged helix-turn-helix (wHTH) protein
MNRSEKIRISLKCAVYDAPMVPPSRSAAGIAFGRYRLFLHRRELLCDDEPVKLGDRAFDVLMVLIETPGALISKDVLMARVWPNRAVEEGNLQAQITALRKALGSDRDLIRTVAGRGYLFTGEINTLPANIDEPVRTDLPARKRDDDLPSTNIPKPISELIGRDEELGAIVKLVAEHQLVSLIGVGGIGKTRLALAAARELLPHFNDGVWFADLSTLSDPSLIPATVATAVGLDLAGGSASLPRVAKVLAGRHQLLVLDTCEHVIGAAATLAEEILGSGSALHIIATSREPLRAGGEWLYPLRPLDVPADDVDDEAERYGAIELFVERARAADPHFAPDRNLMGRIAATCRRLDGIPLAIELAAARATTLGIEELAGRLDGRLSLLAGGRRTALPRHQTLAATLDWSHALLSEDERIIFRRISVFAGAFSLGAAVAVSEEPALPQPQVIDGLSGLVAKSLVAVEGGGIVTRYRLLNTTRDYAFEKLEGSGERKVIGRRHAEYYRDVFERAEAEWKTRPAVEWVADYGPLIDNLRCALDWAFSPEGDASIGLALTAVAVPLWMRLSLLGECHSRAERALATIGAVESRDTRQAMKVLAALGTSLYYIRGPAVTEVEAVWGKALELAESLGDAEFRLQSLWGLWAFHLNSGRVDIALELAQKYCSSAAAGSSDQVTGERMLGMVEHRHGDLWSARRHFERVLAHYEVSNGQQVFYLPVDFRVYTRALLARILWLQGFPDQAMRTAAESVERARSINNATSFHCALSACMVALWVGDLRAAARYIEMLLDSSRNQELPLYSAFGQACQGMLAIRGGDIANGVRHLRAGLDHLGEGNSDLRFINSQLAEALGRAGRIAEGLAAIEGTIDLSDRGREHWTRAEFLRIKSELLLLDGPASAAASEDHLLAALDWAHRQGALSWELRAATSLARILRSRGRSSDAVALLQPIYDRFSEGFDTADLKAAKALLEADTGGYSP